MTITLTEGKPTTIGDERFTFTTTPDYDTTINDDECYGMTSTGYNYWNEARTPRPDDFDGLARKIQTDRGTWVWWQPFDGFADLDAEAQRTAQRQVEDIFTYGFITAIVVKEHTCSDGHWHEADSASLSGIEAFTDTDEIVADLLAELT